MTKKRMTDKGPEALEKILERWLRSSRFAKTNDREEIYRRWGETVGEAIAAHTRVVDFEAGMLHVEVDSPPLLHELSTYYRQEILDSLREVEEFRSVRDIRFRAGSF